MVSPPAGSRHAAQASRGAAPAVPIWKDASRPTGGDAGGAPGAAGLRPRSPQRILVALDASESSQWALDTAAALAARHRAELGLIHVTEPADEGSPRGGDGDGDGDGVDLLCRMASRLPRSVAFTLLTGEGEAGRAIVEAARTWNAELLVIGGARRRRPGAMRRLAGSGSAADHVVRHAPCPVTTVNRPPGAAAAPE